MYFLIDELKKLSQKKKTYFAACCVERVVQIYEFNYDNTIVEPRNIIETIISDLVSDKPDTAKTAKQREILRDLIPDVDEMGSEFTPSMLAGVAMFHLLNCIISYNDADIINALEYSLQAVDSFSEYNEAGLAEEQLWHQKALEIIRENEIYPLNEIRAINEADPKWSELWRD